MADVQIGNPPDCNAMPVGSNQPAMAVYHLHYVDPRGKVVHADRIHCASDSDAVDAAYERHLPVRSELWLGGRLIARFPPNRRLAADALKY